MSLTGFNRRRRLVAELKEQELFPEMDASDKEDQPSDPIESYGDVQSSQDGNVIEVEKKTRKPRKKKE
jgi:hypothetical protein